MTFLKGWKTRLFFGCTFVLGCLSEIQALNLKDALTAIGVSDHQIAVVMLAMSIVGIVLRQVTTEPPAPILKKDP